jgi:hypothetical protein
MVMPVVGTGPRPSPTSVTNQRGAQHPCRRRRRRGGARERVGETGGSPSLAGTGLEAASMGRPPHAGAWSSRFVCGHGRDLDHRLHRVSSADIGSATVDVVSVTNLCLRLVINPDCQARSLHPCYYRLCRESPLGQPEGVYIGLGGREGVREGGGLCRR